MVTCQIQPIKGERIMPDTEKSEKKDFGEGIEVVKETSHEEKDIEINFGKIFSVFKKKEPEGHSKEKAETIHVTAAKNKDEEDVSINLQLMSPFLKKWGMSVLIILGIMISLWLVIDVRLQPEKMPFTDEWASSTVNNVIQSDIQSAINAQYPNLPSDRKSQIVSEEMAKASSSKQYTFKTGSNAGQAVDIPWNIEAYSSMIKEFYEDPSGKPYSPDIDPYYWHRYAKNIVQKGHIGDEVIDGKQYDMHQVAPYGREIASSDYFFPYFIAYLYKGVNFFDHSADLFGVQTTVYPALLSALTILLLFLIGKKIAGNMGGFFAAIMGGLHAAYVNRTIHGDNDAVAVFFAILILWLFINAIYSRKIWLQLLLATAAGLVCGIYSRAWGGWWFIFIFLMITIIASIAIIGTADIIRIITEKKLSVSSITRILFGRKLRMLIVPGLTFFASSGIFVTIFSGLSAFILGVFPIKITQLKVSVSSATAWPNVLTTVAELNPGSVRDVLSQIGQGTFLLAILSSIILMIYAIIHFAIRHSSTRTQEEKLTIAIVSSAIMAAAVITVLIALRILTGPLPDITVINGTAFQWVLQFWQLAAIIILIGSGVIFLALLKLGNKIAANEQAISYSIFVATLIAIWFIGTIYASTKGIRFVLLLAPMAGLGFGITMSFAHKLALWANENIAKDKVTMIFMGISYALIGVIEYLFLKSRLLDTMSRFFTGNSLTLMYYIIFLAVAAILAYAAYWLIQKARRGNFSTNAAISAMIFLIIAIAFTANGPISSAYNIAEHDVPIMNDAWSDSLMAINSTSQPSAIITSWWDFGHQFTDVADRRVTFDGTTQQYPPAHWVGLLFMTSKESDALGILRMIDCSGGDRAFNEINKVENEFHTSIDIVTRLTTIPTAEEAKNILTKDYKFTEAQAKSVVNLTHCNPPEGYVIASDDMIGKSGVWAHFGSWDFEKAIIWSELKNNRTNQKASVEYMIQKFNYSAEKAKSVFNEIRSIKDDSAANSWISPWPSFSAGTAGCQANADNTLSCNLGTATLRVNMTTTDAYFEDGTGSKLHPSSLVYQAKDIYGNSTVLEKKYTTNIMPQADSVLLIPQGGSYYAVLSSPELAYGMFTRMYYFAGVGLTKFQQISHQQGFTGTNIYVYKAIWEKQK
jgi:dolichyl-phosphooligosaccharide-protein glycotransferase